MRSDEGNTCYNLDHADTVKTLIREAMLAREHAYAPYSKFSVGAAILADDGTIYSSANVENASYGSGICAERNAATKAITSGAKQFLMMAVVGWTQGSDSKEDKVFAYPCGMCRQFVNEFASSQLQVIVAKDEETFEIYSFAELFPRSFGPEKL